jgi:protease IV
MTPPGQPLPPPNWQSQPPPVYFPPPVYYPPPARGGFARAIFTTLAVSILGFSLTLNLYLLVMSGLFSAGDTAGIAKEVIRTGGTDVVAVIPVEGIITGQSADDLEKLLRHVKDDPSVKAVVLEIDSPGGEVTASDEMYQRLLAFKEETKLPLIVSMQGLAASGGYYVACAGDHIIAQRTTTTGSIGVYMGGLNISKLMEKYGVEDTSVVSSGSKYKLAGSPYREFTDEMKQYVQTHVDDDLELFKSVVAAGRNLKREVVDTVATGEIFSGTQAAKLKLVDQIGFMDDAIALAESRAGVSGARVVRFKPEVTFWDALAGSGQASVVETTVGQTTVKADKRLVNDLLSPRPMFLYRGH